ncbi:UNVERIFIED_CONTAM: Cof subfamily protein (haloacid dehalogenase superfamily) [Brevibacillus sp. OAP136]
MIKLFVTDLDGTLLDDEKQVPEKNRQALRELAAAGVEVCLASGRMHGELTTIMDDLRVTCHRISQNGSFVYTCEEKLLHSDAFEPELAKELYAAARHYGFVEMISVGQTIYTPNKSEATKKIEARMLMPFEVKSDVVESFASDFAPCKLSYFGEMEKLREMQAAIREAFPGEVEVVVSDVDCVDFMPIHVSKGVGLRFLLKELGVKPEETVVIGDSFNDLSMFTLTPHSFVMAHSDADVRKRASREADSVAQAVEWVLQANATAGVR